MNTRTGGALGFTAASDSISWLSLTPGSGTSPATLVISATVGTLTVGTYTGYVTVTAAGAQGSPATITVTFIVALPVSTASYSISGNVANNGVGIAGVTIYLSGPNSASTTTTSSGNYSFAGLTNGGPYTITPADIAYIFSPLNSQTITTNSANVSGINFTSSTAPPTYSISGTIELASLGVGGGSTVTLTTASTGAVVTSTTANSSGNFSLTGIANGSYVVTPSSPTALFTPASLDVTINGASYTTANFIAEGLIFYDDFTGTSLSSAWTVISRHGEYAQSETECNVPQMVSVANRNVTITTEAQSTTCGDFNIDGTVRHAPASWAYITGDIQWTGLNFTYGTIENRAKFPPSATNLWPPTWLLGSNCQVTNVYTADTGYSTCANLGVTGYTEIDMTECYNSGGWCQFHLANPNFGIDNGCDASYSVDTNSMSSRRFGTRLPSSNTWTVH
jgi:hypothetical protein